MLRGKLLSPLLYVLTKAGISPSAVSYAGLFFMLFFIPALSRPWLAVLVLGAALLMDLIDGPLARFQGNASHAGKFVDMMMDTLVFAIFMTGLAYYTYLNAIIALLFLFFVNLSRLLRTLYKVKTSKIPFAKLSGFLILPTWCIALSYLGFLLAVFGFNVLSPFAAVFSLLLLLDSANFFSKLKQAL